MESPGAYLHARRANGVELLKLGATGAAAALLLTTSGDAFVVVALLGLASLEVTSTAVAAAAFTAVLLRWGSSGLAAVAGAQGVLGPAIAVAPWTGAASAGAAATALICVAPPGPPALAFGLAAGVVASGPAGTSTTRLAIRLGAGIVGALLAFAVARRPVGRRRRLGVVAGVLAVALALPG